MPIFLKPTVLFLVFASLMAATDYSVYNLMTDDLTEPFRQYLKENQPFIIGEEAPSIYWPDENTQVILGRNFKENPDLRQYQEEKGWNKLYMDADMKEELEFYEHHLKPLKPWYQREWLRWELANAMQPHKRQGKPASTVIRNVIHGLIAHGAKRERSAERIERVKDKIRPTFELRYGEGSFDT